MTTDEERDRRVDDVHDVLVAGAAAAQTVGQSLSRKAERPDVWRIATVLTLLGVAASVAIAVPAAQQAARANAVAAAAQKSADDNRQRTDEAFAAANLANEELKRRGQQPVPLPPPSEDNPQDALVAAATARVLASLPQPSRFTEEDFKAAYNAYLMAHPPTVAPELVAQSVAAYVKANPPTPGAQGEPGVTGQKGDQGIQGEKGEKGDQGVPGQDAPPVTASQIMAAFNAAVADNPSLLCAGKGTFTLVKGVLTVPDPSAPGAVVARDIWTCEPTGSPS